MARPHGQVYLVDHTGTTKVTAPGTHAVRRHRFDHDIEVVPSTEVEVDVAR